MSLPEDVANQVYEAIEIARKTGKIKKGVNEVTKALEKSDAKLVAIAEDVSPKEITMHIPVLGKEKNIPVFKVPSKESLGSAVGLSVSTAAVAIVTEGDAKNIIKTLEKSVE